MSLVTLTGYIKVPAEDLAAVLAELPTHVELTRAESGCLLFDVDQDTDDPHVFHVNEQFVDSASFKAHQERVRSSRWGAITTRVERHYKIEGMDA